MFPRNEQVKKPQATEERSPQTIASQVWCGACKIIRLSKHAFKVVGKFPNFDLRDASSS